MPLVRYVECFEWQYDRMSKPSYSELWVYQNPAGEVIVIAAEPGNDHSGMSITNGVERVATDVVQKLGIQFNHFIEYYPPLLNDHGLGRGETFDIVTFEAAEGYRRDFVGLLFDEPTWGFRLRSAIEDLVGGPVLVFEAQR